MVWKVHETETSMQGAPRESLKRRMVTVGAGDRSPASARVAAWMPASSRDLLGLWLPYRAPLRAQLVRVMAGLKTRAKSTAMTNKKASRGKRMANSTTAAARRGTGKRLNMRRLLLEWAITFDGRSDREGGARTGATRRPPGTSRNQDGGCDG